MEHYYGRVLEKFKTNLKASGTLITIGYGQEDERINELIVESFNCSSAKKVIVVDPKKDTGVLLGMSCAHYFGRELGVNDITFEKMSTITGSQTPTTVFGNELW